MVVWRRWDETVLLLTAVLLEKAVFVCVTYVIDRDRPPVGQLDGQPPTSSYPSGHVGTAVALYGALMRRYRGLDGQRKAMNVRYVGSLVADFHRNLLGGGVFCYPASTKSPKGKLRLLYEANPLAFIVREAGGAATDGVREIMNIQPDELHQRTPLYIGSKDEVDQAGAMLGGALSGVGA